MPPIVVNSAPPTPHGSRSERPPASPPNGEGNSTHHGSGASTSGPGIAEVLAGIDALSAMLPLVRMAIVRSLERPTPALLSADQFAARLGVEADTVNAWCRAGRFPSALNWGRAGWRIPEACLAGEGVVGLQTAPSTAGGTARPKSIRRGNRRLATPMAVDEQEANPTPRSRTRGRRSTAAAGVAPADERGFDLDELRRALEDE